MKVSKILIVSFIIVFLLSSNVFAIGDIFSSGEDWMQTGKDEAGIGMDSQNLKKSSNNLYFLLLTIATVVAVIVGAILGVQYMMAGIDKKVEVKESLFPYLISCIVVFGSLGIWKLVVQIISKF